MQINTSFQEKILKNFEEYSGQYNRHANIQKSFALKLADECSKHSIPEGIWIDLGSGTGFLADAIEAKNAPQSVLRIDISPRMLAQQDSSINKLEWDLNLGLPLLPEEPKLIASCFALHWLINPEKKLQEWINALAPKGMLALAVPIKGCFPEWQIAAEKTDLRFTALPFPSRQSLIKALGKVHFHYEKVHKVTLEANKVGSLLKSITKVGANASPHKKLRHFELKKLISAWPFNPNNKAVKLTWLIQMLLIQK
tara:strand:+ start:1325 stop:2086 length:762 start_codon:yes stop_codon:yes gene_type:complete